MIRRALLLGCLGLPFACATHRGSPEGAGAERLRWVQGRAGRLRVSDGGVGGTTVVFVHGLGSDLEVWRAQLDHLRPARRAVAYDQRGHAGSDRARDGVYTIEALVEDLEAVRSDLGLAKMILVGHSMSGEVLTAYAGQHPDRVAGLFYLDATGDAHAFPRAQVEAVVARETAPSFGAAERRAVFEEMLQGARPGTRERVLASLDRLDPPAFWLLRKAIFEFADAPGRLAPYRGPMIAVEGGPAPWPGAASVVLKIERVAVHGVCHWIQLDDPETVNRELDAFLASLPAGD